MLKTTTSTSWHLTDSDLPLNYNQVSFNLNSLLNGANELIIRVGEKPQSHTALL